MTRHLLILDIDETLIHASETELDHAADFRLLAYHAYRRPGLESLLEAAFAAFEVGIWTSSGREYAAAALPEICGTRLDELAFVMTADSCTRRYDPELGEYYWVKDLKKIKRLGYSLDRVIMLDNTPKKLERNYGNLVRIDDFTGNAQDEELARVLPFLLWLAEQPNVRSIEKRGWRQRRVD